MADTFDEEPLICSAMAVKLNDCGTILLRTFVDVHALAAVGRYDLEHAVPNGLGSPPLIVASVAGELYHPCSIGG